MAHDRARSVHHIYSKLIKATPILGIFGHRQVGKTTFINQVTPNYLTFDSLKQKHLAEKDPEKFIRSLKKSPFGIDECQMVPELFPALKDQVRKNQRPGQFILSGSVRFSSRKAIRESLTGRMMFFELYPLIISELDKKPLPDFFIHTLKLDGFKNDSFQNLNQNEINSKLKSIDLYLDRGGLPGICFFREERLRSERLKDIHMLMLDRDLRMVHETKLSLEVLMDFLRMIATFCLQGYSFTEVKKALGLSPITQKALLYALESIFLIRRIPIYGGSKGEIILLEDQYEERQLSSKPVSIDDQLLTLVYRNLRAQFQYRLGMPISLKSYWTRNNARVPLVISQSNQNLGIITINDEAPNLSQMRAAESLLKTENNCKVLILSRALKHVQVINSRLAIVPIANVI